MQDYAFHECTLCASWCFIMLTEFKRGVSYMSFFSCESCEKLGAHLIQRCYLYTANCGMFRGVQDTKLLEVNTTGWAMLVQYKNWQARALFLTVFILCKYISASGAQLSSPKFILWEGDTFTETQPDVFYDLRSMLWTCCCLLKIVSKRPQEDCGKQQSGWSVDCYGGYESSWVVMTMDKVVAKLHLIVEACFKRR